MIKICKTSKTLAAAFHSGKSAHTTNTAVYTTLPMEVYNCMSERMQKKLCYKQPDVTMFFHGEPIAWRIGKHIYATLGGWNNITAMRRINAVLDMPYVFFQWQRRACFGRLLDDYINGKDITIIMDIDTKDFYIR